MDEKTRHAIHIISNNMFMYQSMVQKSMAILLTMKKEEQQQQHQQARELVKRKKSQLI